MAAVRRSSRSTAAVCNPPLPRPRSTLDQGSFWQCTQCTSRTYEEDTHTHTDWSCTQCAEAAHPRPRVALSSPPSSWCSSSSSSRRRSCSPSGTEFRGEQEEQEAATSRAGPEDGMSQGGTN